MTSDCNHLPTGFVIHGQKRKYTITRVLGQGGFGITYHAMGDVIVDGIETKAEFAIKEFFKSDHCYREADNHTMGFSRNSTEIVTDTMNDFETEARRLFKLPSHPGIVKVSEVFSANNTRYYAMQYLGNMSLDKVEVPMREGEALELIVKIGEALQFLHDNNITHLDIKPQNIILRDNRPVLIDFGLSRHYDHHGQATKSSFNGGGYSEGYSPIEQYAGINRFSPECDVYALGATLFYLLTGNRPIGAVDISAEWINSNLPSTISISVRRALCNAMEQRQRDRTRSVTEFINELYTPVTESGNGITTDEDVIENSVRINPIKLSSAIENDDTTATSYLHNADEKKSGAFLKGKSMWIALLIAVAATVAGWGFLRFDNNVDNAVDRSDGALIDSVKSVLSDSVKSQQVMPIKEDSVTTAIPAKTKTETEGPTDVKKPIKQNQPAKVNSDVIPETETLSEPTPNQQVDEPEKKPEKKKPAPPAIDPMSGKYF